MTSMMTSAVPYAFQMVKVPVGDRQRGGGPPPCRDRRKRAGRSRVVSYSWVPCLAGSSDTSTSRDDPATLSCLSYRPRQIALKKPRHLPLKVTSEALDDLRQSGHRSLTTGTPPGQGATQRGWPHSRIRSTPARAGRGVDGGALPGAMSALSRSAA